jgi:tRNA pseudouridine38-40 synthase
MRVKAIVAYDGTGYRGFQRQATGLTVQEALETAIEKVSGTRSSVLAAGRTDAGVHAEGQVIAFDTQWGHPLSDLERALNAVLPPDIAVRETKSVSARFHPRYDAHSRRYRYTIYNAPVRSPLARRTSLFVARPLDVAGMASATPPLVGEHDFAAFGRPPKGEVTIRRVMAADWARKEPWLFFEIEANAFLFRMVRSIVGTLLKIGQGKLPPDQLATILASRDRSRAGPTAPPHGLCLIQVRY